MKTLYDLYDKVKTFADNHPLVNEFVLVSSEEELESKEFEFRSLVLMPTRSNISRESNRPVYEVTFTLVIFDRVERTSPQSVVMSSEENIFITGQLQDFLLQELGDSDVDFNEIDIINAGGSDYNITSTVCEFTVILPRSPYNKTIAQ